MAHPLFEQLRRGVEGSRANSETAGVPGHVAKAGAGPRSPSRPCALQLFSLVPRLKVSTLPGIVLMLPDIEGRIVGKNTPCGTRGWAHQAPLLSPGWRGELSPRQSLWGWGQGACTPFWLLHGAVTHTPGRVTVYMVIAKTECAALGCGYACPGHRTCSLKAALPHLVMSSSRHHCHSLRQVRGLLTAIEN